MLIGAMAAVYIAPGMSRSATASPRRSERRGGVGDYLGAPTFYRTASSSAFITSSTRVLIPSFLYTWWR